MPKPDRSMPMPVKHWSFAGLMLTYWCNARCESCYLCCGPDAGDEMSVEQALRLWQELIAASPHGCRIHLSGGEPFGDWDRLIELCRKARAQGLAPLEKIETNAFWAADAPVIRDRLRQLNEAGMRKLAVSADPYHQQFVPIERCRLLAGLAEEILGPGRVQVRWRDWLSDGFDTSELDPNARSDLFSRYAAGGRDRLNGRAAALGAAFPRKPASDFADNSCGEALLRSRHVHVDGVGRLMPGTCAGIVLGLAGQRSVAEIWRQLYEDHAARPIVGTLASQGPVGLMERPRACGFAPRDGYASKCELCWDVRRFLASVGDVAELAPRRIYEQGDGV